MFKSHFEIVLLLTLVCTIEVSVSSNLFDKEKDLEKIDDLFQNKPKHEADIFNQLLTDEICNIPIETFESLTQEKFLAKYAFSSPVVIRHSNTSDRNRLFQEKCKKENLLKEFGDKPVTVSTANTHSYRRYSIRFKEYIQSYVNVNEKTETKQKLKYGNETWYFFGENNYSEWKNLLDLYERPKLGLTNHIHAYSFGVSLKVFFVYLFPKIQFNFDASLSLCFIC
jgi:hypothetical protein